MLAGQKLLIATVGLPRSGKSTWAEKMRKGNGLAVVCPDAIRLALHGQPFRGQAEPLVWAIAKTMVRSLFLAGHGTVVVDATNTTRARRNEWLDADWWTTFHYLPTERQICVERAAADYRPDLIPVIDRMAARFEALGDDERLFATTMYPLP